MRHNFFFSDMAQRMLQMSVVQHDIKYEKLQGLQQISVLQCVSTFGTCRIA